MHRVHRVFSLFFGGGYRILTLFGGFFKRKKALSKRGKNCSRERKALYKKKNSVNSVQLCPLCVKKTLC